MLEFDEKRGVLYIHNKKNGCTVLRICRLPKPDRIIDMNKGMIDITYGYGVSYPFKIEGE